MSVKRRVRHSANVLGPVEHNGSRELFCCDFMLVARATVFLRNVLGRCCDVHAPYRLPRPSGLTHCADGDAYGKYLEGLSKDLAAFIEDVGRHRDTIWAVTADHGESLGERGRFGHASNLFEEQIHVPLLIGGEGIRPGTVSRPVTGLDLPATLLQLAGANIPVTAPRLPLPGDKTTQARPAVIWDANACALIQGRHKLLADPNTGTLFLFDLLTDPGERTNVAQQNPSLTRQLFAALVSPPCSTELGKLTPLLPTE